MICLRPRAPPSRLSSDLNFYSLRSFTLACSIVTPSSPSPPWQPPGRLSAGLHVHTMKKNARQF